MSVLQNVEEGNEDLNLNDSHGVLPSQINSVLLWVIGIVRTRVLVRVPTRAVAVVAIPGVIPDMWARFATFL